MHHRPTYLLLLVIVMLAAACGSTVQVGSQAGSAAGVPGSSSTGAAGPVPDDGLGLPEGPPANGNAAEGDARSTGQAGTFSGSASGSTATNPSRTGPSQQGNTAADPAGGGGTRAAATDNAGPSAGASGRGYTADEIYIGVIYTENASYANEAAGLEGATRGDQRRFIDLMIEHVNENGGLFGRTVVPVYHAYDGTSSEDHATKEQAACATFTQDNEVFAVSATAEETLISCLAQAGVPHVSGQGKRDADADLYAAYPTYFEVDHLSVDVIAQLQARGLDAQGYYKPTGPTGAFKLGLVRYDLPGYDRVVKRTLRPELARLGIEIAEEARVSAPYGVGDYGTVTQQVSNAVLRFRREGVTHVIFMESSGDLALFWMQTAESQNYRPRYGLTSDDAGEILADNVPHAQLEDALAVGWQPTTDFTADNEPDTWPARERCRKIFADDGYEFTDRNAEGVALLYCDAFRFLQAGAAAAGGAPSSTGLVGGFEQLGTSFQPALNVRALLSPDRHFGTAGYYHYAWNTDCECFRMTSEWLPTPS